MIAYLKGTIQSQLSTCVIVKTNNVGYKVYLKPTELLELKKDDDVELYIHPHIKEDAFDLFGFKTTEELSFFEKLISVSGIGPKTGLALLSTGTTKDILTAIQEKNTAFLTEVPGIGKKTAHRVILELQDKLSDEDITHMATLENSDAVHALVGLGYSKSEALQALSKVTAKNPEKQVKEALQYI
ncbi:Holliday junction branch migration protein RuvA [Patescibacteria group bacterium]|nr:Holliday junction branch migration protein RuvA [Patescibacteria group bacterium]